MGSIEKSHIKISLTAVVLIILFVIAQAASACEWKANIESDQRSFDEKLSSHTVDIKDLQQHDIEQDIGDARIEEKLDNIESLIMELKEDIKNLQ